jgi:hypothetical protein
MLQNTSKKTSKQMEIAVLITSSAYHKRMEMINHSMDYESTIFDSLVTQNGNANSSGNKHLWIKKATGLGISEFMLRFMAWLCLKDNALSGSHIYACIAQ